MALNAIIHQKRFAWWQRFQQAPYPTLAQTLSAQRQRILTELLISRTQTQPTVAICISDTHNSQPVLPPGDILIHAGDLTQGGTVEELQSQLDWLNTQPHRHKVVIAGNHDIALDKDKSGELGNPNDARHLLRWGSLIYLDHSSANLKISGSTDSLTVFGHPSTRKNGNWAFQHPAGTDVFTHQICEDVDLLITHSPPRFHLDVAGWGDEFLLQELWRVRPRLHVFGHIHEGRGREILVYDQFERLYERVCTGSAGILALLHMVLLLVTHIWISDRSCGAQRTILVNASITGGLRDDKKREPQIITL